MNRRNLTATGATLLGVLALASVTAVVGFRAVFVDWEFVTAAIVGAVGAAAIVGVAWWRNLLLGESVALSVVGLGLFGAVAARGLPTPAAFRSVFEGLRSGWADLLSLSPPADLTPELRVLPFVLAWIGATVGGELLRRTRTPAVPIMGPLIALAVTVLITAEDRSVAVVQGAVIAVAALIIGLVQFRDGQPTSASPAEQTDENDAIDSEPLAATGPARRRMALIRAVVVLVVVGVAAPFVGPRLPFAEAYERFDLRDRNDPPWDPLTVASPLVELKASLRENRVEDRVFAIESDAPITRIPVAVLGDYDGVVWTVGSARDADVIDEFRPVGERLPDPTTPVRTPNVAVTGEIVIDQLDGPFVPLPSRAVGLRFDETSVPPSNEPQMRDDVRMNLITSTVAVPRGLEPGLRYEFDSIVTTPFTDAELEELTIAPLPPRDEDDIMPPQVRNLAADLVEGVDDGWRQIEAIRDRFVDDGFYDTSRQARPGHALSRLATFLDQPDRIIGYEEQYAAAAAVLGQAAGIPTRVVVGYLVPEIRYVDGRADVLSGDISAWIEVDFGVNGWVPVDVSPDRSREPQAEASGKTIQDVAIPSPPPPPQIPPTPEVLASAEEEVEDDDEEEDETDEPAAAGGPGLALAAGVVGGGLILLLAFAAGLVAMWKARRRRRRRRAPDAALQVEYAWSEVLDRFDESGLQPNERATPAEAVRIFTTSSPAADDAGGDLRSLARLVERSAYHADPPHADDATTAWNYHDHVVSSVYEHEPFGKRLRMRVDPRTLRRRWGRAQDRR